MKTCLWSILCLLCISGSVYASSGDRAPEFQECVARLQAKDCTTVFSLPLSLRITRWSCADNCKYICMHYLTDLAVVKGDRIHQYHGKWPFWRCLGMQEPASVLFSLLNLYFHVLGIRKMKRRMPDGHPMQSFYINGAFISINAWFWSAIFHTRDIPLTEKMDYFAAAAAILYSLYYAIIRLFHIYPSFHTGYLSPSRDDHPIRHIVRKTWSGLCLLVYVVHVSYLSLLPRFDYTYNMTFNLVIGLTHNAFWLLYSLPARASIIRRFPTIRKSYRPSYAWKPAAFVVLTIAATSLELFDFPPWRRTLDAHALWHLCTAPIIPFWYEFLIQDTLDDGWRPAKISS